MNNILLALLFTWCVYNTWSIEHNYKQDKRSNLIDQCTLRVLQLHAKRIDRLETFVKQIEGEIYERKEM